jgi:hypothetical protein
MSFSQVKSDTFALAYSVGLVVEQLTQDYKIKGLKPASAGIGKEKIVKRWKF